MNTRAFPFPAWLAVLGLLAGVTSATAADPQRVASSGSAFVSADEENQAWTIGNELIVLTLGRSGRNSAALLALGRPGEEGRETSAAAPLAGGAARAERAAQRRAALRGRLIPLTLDAAAPEIQQEAPAVPQASFVAGATRLVPGQGSLKLKGAAATETGGAVRLALTFEDADRLLRVTRFYACYPRAPGIETWSTFETMGTPEAVTLSDVGLWKFTVHASEVNWVTGLEASPAAGGRFTRRQQALEPEGWFELGSERRSSESAVPAAWLRAGDGHLFAGLMWSGAWSLTVSGPDAAGLSTVRLSLGAVSTSISGGKPFESPHGFFGVAGGLPSDVPAALQTFARHDVRAGRPLRPLVTYNTWFAYGIGISENAVKAEMDQAVALGAEVFVVDAGWYPGGTQASDYSTGIGTWEADARRFPSGLSALSDHAHGLGMKFGIWIEPERTDMRAVNRPGLAREQWLATTAGHYNPGVKNSSAGSAQICLASAEARQWVLDQVSRVIAESKADYLKWDNNYWINCDRSGHGHGANDGNLAHVKGLYGILAALRERYPGLVIENCSGGGYRLDFGMLRLTDVGWMDDQSAPSPHVRHNLEGLSAIFPAEYLLSFVMDHPGELIHGAADMAYTFRSRMPGALGMSLIGAEFDDRDHEQMRDEVALSKWVRSVAPQPHALLLSGQADAGGGPGWDAIGLFSPESGSAVVFTYATAGAAGWATIRLQALVPERRYVVRALDGRVLAEASGAVLMADGVQVPRRTESAATVLIIEAADAPSPLRR